jgi:transcriptional regulator with XRE-family HTH domain
MNKELLGLKLRRLREVNGATREQVADILNVDPTTYGRYESGHSLPDMDKLKALADFHRVTIDSLLSADPMILSIQHAEGTQVGNGLNARFVQHMVGEDFVKEVFVRIDKLMERQESLNAKLMELLAERLTTKN